MFPLLDAIKIKCKERIIFIWVNNLKYIPLIKNKMIINLLIYSKFFMSLCRDCASAKSCFKKTGNLNY